MDKQEATAQAVDLVARIQAGDRGAEAELYKTYSRGLMIMLTQRTGDPQLAADLHQDAMIVVLERLRADGLKDPEQLRAFLWATASNLFINEYRKNKRRATDANSELYANVADEGVAGQGGVLLSEQTAEMVAQLIDELKQPRDRRILRRYFVEEVDKQRICEELELSPEHFDRVVHRAKARLKQLIQHRLSREDWL